MAFGTESRIFRSLLTEVLGTSQAAILLPGDTLKAALYNDTVTPDRDAANTASRYNTGTWVTGNEVSSSGQWAAGGVALTSVALTPINGGIVMLDAADAASGSAATLSDVRGTLVYDDTATNKPALSYNSFGGAQAVSNGTFTIVWAANGIWRFTV